MIELPGVKEDGMSGRNEQRKLGTARGSPRRTRTAKASRISRHAVKSRCAREWGGWGRLSDDGPGHYNPDLSEDPWGGGGMSDLVCSQNGPREVFFQRVDDSDGAEAIAANECGIGVFWRMRADPFIELVRPNSLRIGGQARRTTLHHLEALTLE